MIIAKSNFASISSSCELSFSSKSLVLCHGTGMLGPPPAHGSVFSQIHTRDVIHPLIPDTAVVHSVISQSLQHKICYSFPHTRVAIWSDNFDSRRELVSISAIVRPVHRIAWIDLAQLSLVNTCIFY